MTDWSAEIEVVRERLLEEFNRDPRFEVKSSTTIYGDVDVDERLVPVDVVVPEAFPYAAPTVRPIDGTGGLSWHASADGTLCLWATEDSSDLPWLHADQIVQRARAWFKSDADGWPNDTPDLDLERYWTPTAGFVVYPNLDGLVGFLARAERSRGVWRVKPGRAPERGRQVSAFAVDLGELTYPVHNYDEICELLDNDISTRLSRLVERGKVALLLVRYWRAAQSAVLALTVVKRRPVELHAVASAHDGDAALHLRAGEDREALQSRRVAIAGVGAVGSVTADLLGRAGVGHLTLLDPDIVRPGNSIRHIAGLSHVGQPKVNAVRDELQRDRSLGCVVDPRHEPVSSPAEAADLLRTHDLVVDATANGVATRLLLDAGAALARPVISVCLVRNGQVARVDRVPLSAGENHAPAVPDLVDPGPALHESGCGDPVSPTPMWAATAAASRTAGMAVDLLTGRHQYPPSIIDVLVAGTDECPTIGTRR